MKTIRAEHPLKDAMLARAYGRAQRYLEICLENLNSQLPDAQLPPRTTAILRAILGHEPTPQTVSLLRDYTRRILSELLSDSLSLADSKRIVVGVNMPNVKDTYAFVYNNDPQKRIFLTERFFNLAFEVEAYVRAPREELLAHQQAVTLIHELSHQTLKAVDIAYVEASLPFTDQFSLETQGGRLIYSQVVDYRRRGLSHSTEDDKLFKIKKYKSDWRDLKDEDGEALATIFRLTKKDNLIAARAEFHDKAQVRTDIILANADSLALFISKLGRRRFTPAG
jgi:hypothetical protein